MLLRERTRESLLQLQSAAISCRVPVVIGRYSASNVSPRTRMMTAMPTQRRGSCTRRHGVWHLVERAAWLFGAACLLGASTMYVAGVVGARRELERFAVLRAASPLQADRPDLSLWSPE